MDRLVVIAESLYPENPTRLVPHHRVHLNTLTDAHNIVWVKLLVVGVVDGLSSLTLRKKNVFFELIQGALGILGYRYLCVLEMLVDFGLILYLLNLITLLNDHIVFKIRQLLLHLLILYEHLIKVYGFLLFHEQVVLVYEDRSQDPVI